MLTQFGADDHGWDIDNPAGSGEPGIALFANALQVWAVLQTGPVTVEAAAFAFHATRDCILKAVEWHAYMLLGPGDTIQHDGE